MNNQNPMMPLPHKILSVKHETQMEYTFRVEYNGTPVKNGQFFQISVPKVGEAPISVSDMGDGYLEFTIRKVGKLTNDIFSLVEGDVLFLRGPYGNNFPTEQFDNKNLVVIAGGTGVSPVRSLLKHYLRNEKDTKGVYFIAGFKDYNSVLFRPDLESFKNSSAFHTVYTLDHEKAEGFEQGFCVDHLSKIPFDEFNGDYNIVIVGPPIMMKLTAQACIKQGVPEDKIWVSFERKMSCGLGKCGHCKVNETYVCLEGPVFSYVKAKNLMD